MEMKFLREVLKKTKYKININIRSEFEVGKIKNDIQKSRLRYFGHVMQMTEARIPKKILHTKMKGKQARGRPRTRLIDLEMRKGKWEEIEERKDIYL